MRLAIACLLLAVNGLPARTAVAEELTIYRCTDAQGRLSVRDTPCLKGATQQQAQTLQRPRDPPAPPASPAPSVAPAPAPVVHTQVIYRTPPRPMYECITGEGERYTSDNDEGNPRWVPLWAQGYVAVAGAHGAGRGGHGYTGAIVPYGSTWVRDSCHVLPQQEVCARLSDRRYEIMRRYNSALQSERRELDLEQRGIDARMANDCGDT